jgi:hypothetical protein
MLLLMQAKAQAARAICLLAAVESDLPGPAAAARAALLIPVAKAWSTDVGVEVASLGVQVHGGMGFIEETGAAQHYRDARIAPIYEGTNGIQAIDLAGRKLADGGAALFALLDDVQTEAAALDGDLAEVGARLAAAAEATREAGAWLAARAGGPDALAGASQFLSLLGDATGGWLWPRGATRPQIPPVCASSWRASMPPRC